MTDSRHPSIWNRDAGLPHLEPLDGDAKCDVLVIGGGIAGLLCAYFLRQAGLDCILAEAGRVCGGVTGNTTAKITAQHGLIYAKLLDKFGPEKAGLYLQANLEALEKYRSLCRETDCDFREEASFVYAMDRPDKLRRELAALRSLGYPARMERELPLPFPTAGAVCFEKQGQFHPLKFLAAISKDLRIYEDTRVLALEPGRALTARGSIYADRVIVTTHFPFMNRHGSYFLKLYQHRSYVLALQGAPPLSGMYLDEAEDGLSFRNHGELLLLGGGSHRTGKSGGGWAELEDFARRRYPGSRVVARWATQDCMSLDGMPYIGQYSRNTPGLYVATGFNKWGMSSSMVAAGLLCDLLRGIRNPYAELFSPSRSILRPQLAVNAWETSIHLAKPTAPRCTHLGCALSYNRQEHSWDCPCHGSRYTGDGRLLDNPATRGLKKRKS